VLKLSGTQAINCWRRPVILPREVFPGACVNHWLYCEDMSLLHETHCFILSVMRYARCLMENTTDSMATVWSYNRVTQRFNMVWNNIAALSVHSIRFAIFNCLHQRIMCCCDQLSRAFTNFTNTESFIQVSMETFEISCYIEIDNVSIFEWSCVRNAVTNDFIYWCATTARESVIVQRWWVSSLFNYEIVDCFIDFLCRDSWPYHGMT